LTREKISRVHWSQKEGTKNLAELCGGLGLSSFRLPEGRDRIGG